MIKLLKNTFKKTKLHTKLLITYSSFIILILIILSIFFYRYSLIILEGSVKKSFEHTVSTIKKRIDYSFNEMNSLSDRIKENNDFKNELYKFKKEEASLGNRFTYNIWMKKILLDALNIDSEIYRVSVFNEKGDFLSTNDHIYESEVLSKIVTDSQWYMELMSGKVKEYILEPHYDDWINNRHVMVYSIIKPISMYDEIVGFVEIQKRLNEYSEIASGMDSDAIIAIVKDNGKVFYSNKKLFSKTLINHYLNIASGTESGIQIKSNPFSNILEIVAFAKSKNKWTAYVIQNYRKTLDPLQSVNKIVVLAVIVIIIISIMFVYLFSKRLTIPLRKLKDNIEKVNVSNLNKKGTSNNIFEHDEIEVINRSFLEMQKRLKEAMETQIKSRSLQAKAHFDALQARINPHFIFNMLGIVVNMAEESDQNEIAYVCRKLAKMLRYSTKSSDALTTMKEEIEHAQDYLSLMKNRFEHRLDYVVDVDGRLMNVTVPKFIVQPLIENSITHGFSKSPVEIMEIKIFGKVNEKDQWEISIFDNGSGFDKEVLQGLNERIIRYKEKILKYEKPEELSIGGMGIVNTFVRLDLYFGDKAEFDIKNNEQCGALITIRGPIISKKLE